MRSFYGDFSPNSSFNLKLFSKQSKKLFRLSCRLNEGIMIKNWFLGIDKKYKVISGYIMFHITLVDRYTDTSQTKILPIENVEFFKILCRYKLKIYSFPAVLIKALYFSDNSLFCL